MNNDPNTALIAMYTNDELAAQGVTNAYLAVQHDVLICLLAALVLIGIAVLFKMRGGAQ